MAKFLKVGTSGFPTEESAISTSAGAGDAGKIIETNGAGKLDETLLPAGIGSDTKTAVAAESISAGDLVYFNASGQILKADANALAKAAVGFALTSISAAASGTVHFDGTIAGLSGLTPGAWYFLSAVAPGGISTAVPTGAGDIVQPVGIAVSATELTFQPAAPVVRS